MQNVSFFFRQITNIPFNIINSLGRNFPVFLIRSREILSLRRGSSELGLRFRNSLSSSENLFRVIVFIRESYSTYRIPIPRILLTSYRKSCLTVRSKLSLFFLNTMTYFPRIPNRSDFSNNLIQLTIPSTISNNIYLNFHYILNRINIF